VVLTYPGAQALDAVGPMEVFTAADRIVGGGAYAARLVGATRAPQPVNSGYALVPAVGYRSVRGPFDTLVVAGGSGSRTMMEDADLIAWLRRMAVRTRRVTSVCTGAFLLARAGLLDGRRATTHWAHCEALAHGFPSVEVDPDPIFVRDGNVYTSAGVTAGIDLALALVEDDLGREVALQVARHLVVYLKRPGGQSQFSVALDGQRAARRTFEDLVAFVAEHPSADLSVAALAARCGMSPRNFARRFQEELGETPARYVSRTRVEIARRLLEETDGPIEEVAERCGFGSTETMRRGFVATLGVPPHDYRGRFGRRSA
jgi:transcriptional regulator GlxA family with amidase domain